MHISLEASVLQGKITGVGRATIGLYDACARHNPSLVVEALHRRPFSEKLPETIKDIQLWAPFITDSLWRSSLFTIYNKYKNPDIIHFPLPHNDKIRKYENSSVVFTLHDVIPLALEKLYFKNESTKKTYCKHIQENIDNSDLIVTDSEASKCDIVKSFMLKSEPLVVYPASLLPEYRESQFEVSNKKHFIYVGGFERRKGLDILIPMYNDLYTRKIVNVPLVVVGLPYFLSSKLDNDIELAKRSGAVVLKGYVSDEELVGLLRNAVALVYPSRYEGFGYPPLEAMGQGCPVITTKAGSIREVCEDAVLYTEVGNRESLSRAVIQVYNNIELRKKMSVWGRKQAKKFAWADSAVKYLKGIEQVSNIRQKKS